MEWSPETLQFLSHCFLNTLSPSPEPRRAAERSLAEASERSNYGLAVLRLVAEPAVDEQVKQAAAVNFKNHMKSRWAPATRASNRNAVTVNPIPDTEKKQIKDLIVPLMLSATPRVQSQLSEALAVIGQHDFPKLWPELLPELVAMLQKAVEGTDYTSVKGILGTINSLFKKFRYQYWTNEVKLDLRYCLDNFAAPLLEVFKVTATLIDSRSGSGGPADALKALFESQRLCCRISYSFNFQELPDYFEDHMEEWMVLFQRYLTATYPTLEQGGGDGLALVDNLRAAICDILALYMGRDEDPFKRYVDEFGRAVRDLLVAASASSGRDKLVIPATKFLTMVSTNAHQNKLFSEDSSLDQICRSIVIPNVMLMDEDEELFEMNYIEFIRRDMEGSDLDTRRRIACELLKAIAINYKEKVSQLVLGLVQSMLAMFAENPSSNWKYKDCAIYVVLSLSTTRAGGASVSDTVIDVATFFTSVIVPELQGQDVNSYPFLKAGALKFFTLFRNVLPKSNAIVLVPDVVRFLASESNVVHSYAAICIEKLLLVKDEGARARYLASDIAPFLPGLMTNLFNALGLPESEENQYIMKCIMRVLGVADISPEVAASCISRLTYILNAVCKNPKNPIFNHYLFESVAVLIRRACTNPTLLSQFEAGLFPSLESILSNNVIEFFPYTFQLLAQLVELNRPPLPNHYMQFFNILLFPELWKKPSDVPALVPLLQAFLRMAPSELKAQEKLDKVLGIFSHLVSTPSTEEQGFFVLNTIVGNVGYDVLAPHMGSIWIALFTRLQNSRTMKFLKSLIIFMSLVVVKHGWQSLVEPMNSVQPNVFLVILEQFWIPNLKQITGFVEVKLAAVASTKLICECPALLDPSTARLWGKMLDSIVTLLSRPEEERVEDEPEVPDFAESGGYSATFVRLYNSGKKEDDPLKEIKDPKAFLLSSLSNLPAFSTGGYRQVINENLEPANQAALFQLCGTPANA